MQGPAAHLFNGFPQVVRERHSVQRPHRQRHQVTAQLAELLSWSQAGDSGVRGIKRDGRRQPTSVPRTALLAGRPAVGPLGLICFGRVSKQVPHVLEVVPRCQHRGQATNTPTAWRRRLEAPARGRRVQGAAQEHVLGRKHASCGVPKVPPRWRALQLPRLSSRAECPVGAGEHMDDDHEFFDAEDTFHDDGEPAAEPPVDPVVSQHTSSEPGTPAVQPLDSSTQPLAPSPRLQVTEPYPLHRCATRVSRCCCCRNAP